jgi:hypothetical protein
MSFVGSMFKAFSGGFSFFGIAAYLAEKIIPGLSKEVRDELAPAILRAYHKAPETPSIFDDIWTTFLVIAMGLDTTDPPADHE